MKSRLRLIRLLQLTYYYYRANQLDPLEGPYTL